MLNYNVTPAKPFAGLSGLAGSLLAGRKQQQDMQELESLMQSGDTSAVNALVSKNPMLKDAFDARSNYNSEESKKRSDTAKRDHITGARPLTASVADNLEYGRGQGWDMANTEQAYKMLLSVPEGSERTAMEDKIARTWAAMNMDPGAFKNLSRASGWDAPARETTDTTKNYEYFANMPPGPGKQAFGKKAGFLTDAGEPANNFKPEMDLRKEFLKLTGEYQTIDNAWRRIASSGDNAAGDLSLIFNYMKMLDPGSTVREGEFATAQNAAGVDERARNVFNNLLTGERLSVDQRAEFKGQAETLFSAAGSKYSRDAGRYKKLAYDYGLDPEKIVLPGGTKTSTLSGSDPLGIR